MARQPMPKRFLNPEAIRKELKEICNRAIDNAEDSLLLAAYPRFKLSAEETAEIPQAISKIKIANTSVDTSLWINDKLCTDWDKI